MAGTTAASPQITGTAGSLRRVRITYTTASSNNKRPKNLACTLRGTCTASTPACARPRLMIAGGPVPQPAKIQPAQSRAQSHSQRPSDSPLDRGGQRHHGAQNYDKSLDAALDGVRFGHSSRLFVLRARALHRVPTPTTTPRIPSTMSKQWLGVQPAIQKDIRSPRPAPPAPPA